MLTMKLRRCERAQSLLRVVQVGEDVALVDDTLDGALRDDARLRHLLHGQQGLALLELDLPDLAEAAFADGHVVEEAVLRYRAA